LLSDRAREIRVLIDDYYKKFKSWKLESDELKLTDIDKELIELVKSDYEKISQPIKVSGQNEVSKKNRRIVEEYEATSKKVV
jgi:hypothetical protein